MGQGMRPAGGLAGALRGREGGGEVDPKKTAENRRERQKNL